MIHYDKEKKKTFSCQLLAIEGTGITSKERIKNDEEDLSRGQQL